MDSKTVELADRLRVQLAQQKQLMADTLANAKKVVNDLLADTDQSKRDLGKALNDILRRAESGKLTSAELAAALKNLDNGNRNTAAKPKDK